MVTGNMHGKSCISDPSDVLPSDHPSAFAKINFIAEVLSETNLKFLLREIKRPAIRWSSNAWLVPNAVHDDKPNAYSISIVAVMIEKNDTADSSKSNMNDMEWLEVSMG